MLFGINIKSSVYLSYNCNYYLFFYMIYRYCIIFCFLVVTSFCNAQNEKPAYQSNPSLVFRNFLSGIKSVYVVIDDKNVQFINDNPNSGNAQLISGLFSYLKAIGLEDVKWGKASFAPTNFSSYCDLLLIYPSWDVQFEVYKNLSLKFKSCLGDIFQFKSDDYIFSNAVKNLTTSFHNIFMSMYGYKVDSYSSYNRLTLKSEMTDWTEEKLKNHFKKNGADSIEGIYESAMEKTTGSANYKLGLVKASTGYNLIYFSGALNYLDWKRGEIKAKLHATTNRATFHTDYVMANKEINKNPVIVLDQELMKVVFQNVGDETTYTKTFPTSNDNINAIKARPVSGTGIAVTPDGLIVTTEDLVDGATNLQVRGIKGDFSKTYSASLVIADKNNNLAIIKINDSSFKTLGIIPYLISRKTSDVGSAVFIMGYPEKASTADEIKLANGIISSKSGFEGDVTSYQFTGPAQAGNSGAPLFDSKGNLIGIADSRHAGKDNNTYAIKSAFLLTLFDIMQAPPKLPTISKTAGKSLTEQVKLLKPFTYIIESK